MKNKTTEILTQEEIRSMANVISIIPLGLMIGLGAMIIPELYKEVRKDIDHRAVAVYQIKELEKLGKYGNYGGGHYMPTHQDSSFSHYMPKL